MLTVFYVIIAILFFVHILWTWNSTKGFEATSTRISYIVIGTLFITFCTYIIFCISKRGIEYENEEVLANIRNIILLIFVPINGFAVLPQLGRIVGKVKDDSMGNQSLKRTAIIFLVIAIIVIIFECYYFGDIQNRIMQVFELNRENLE